MSGIAQIALTTALALTIRAELLAVICAIFIYMVAVLGTWIILRTQFAAYSDTMGPHEAILLLRLENLGSSVVLLAMRLPQSLVDSVFSALEILNRDIIKIVASAAFGLLCLGLLMNGSQITAAFERLRCDMVPTFEAIPMRLLNVARILYDSIWPFVNLVYENYRFVTSGYQKVLRACNASNIDIFDVFRAIASALGELGTAMGNYFGAGMLSSRLDLEPFFYQVGLIANVLHDPLMCFCAFLEDVIEMAVAVPQIEELHEGLSAAVNVAVRTFQMIVNSLINLAAPDFTEIFEEAITAETQLLEFARLVILRVMNFLLDLIDTIGFLIPMMYEEELKTSLKMTYDDSGLEFTPRRVTLADMIHAAKRTSASPLLRGQGQVESAWGTPIWNLPPNSNLSDILGLRRILLILESRWSYVVSKPIAFVLSSTNLTLNAISHSYELFDTPAGIAYFQINRPMSYLREAVTAVGYILYFLDENLVPVWQGMTEGALYYGEAVAEIFIGFLHSIIFPRWLPGPNPPTDCSVPGTCSYSNMPGNWTAFNFFPYYYSWEGNAIRVSLRTFQNNSDNIAILLGCDNNTVTADNCTELPFQCSIRTLNLLAVEYVNQTNLGIFYLPDLVRFNAAAGLKTFQDLSPARLVELWNLFVECLTTWYGNTLLFSSPPPTYST
jgi:hypothetical protein